MRTNETWVDPENDCITVIQAQHVPEHRAKGLLGASADLAYISCGGIR